jgi:hypothetical protein
MHPHIGDVTVLPRLPSDPPLVSSHSWSLTHNPAADTGVPFHSTMCKRFRGHCEVPKADAAPRGSARKSLIFFAGGSES